MSPRPVIRNNVRLGRSPRVSAVKERLEHRGPMANPVRPAKETNRGNELSRRKGKRQKDLRKFVSLTH